MRKALFESFIHGPLTEPAPKPDEAGLAELANAVNRAARARLGRSLSIRHVDAGSCNGCELEIHALSNAFYDLERFGFHFVASPRHADVLMVTGPVTKNMREALLRTYNATPDPKWVVAVGACAVDGGLFAGSYAVAGGVKDVVPVDLTIPGCPPNPKALLAGLLALLQNKRCEACCYGASPAGKRRSTDLPRITTDNSSRSHVRAACELSASPNTSANVSRRGRRTGTG